MCSNIFSIFSMKKLIIYLFIIIVEVCFKILNVIDCNTNFNNTFYSHNQSMYSAINFIYFRASVVELFKF